MTEDRPSVQKPSVRRRMFTALLILVLVLVVFLAAKSVMLKRPDDLGLQNGRLPGCPDSPNCVSTEAADEPHRIEPLTFSGSADEAMDRLKQAVAQMPRTGIVSEDDRYLHVEFTTMISRYVDDVEFLIDAESGEIRMRSASRTGYSDLGTNRRRLSALRTAFESAAK